MGSHLINGEFQSDKYPETPRGLVPLKPTDPMAQDLLWEYAQRRREVDPEFAVDLVEALRLKGYIRCEWLKENDGQRCAVARTGLDGWCPSCRKLPNDYTPCKFCDEGWRYEPKLHAHAHPMGWQDCTGRMRKS